jgi:hypothetical protein
MSGWPLVNRLLLRVRAHVADLRYGRLLVPQGFLRLSLGRDGFRVLRHVGHLEQASTASAPAQDRLIHPRARYGFGLALICLRPSSRCLTRLFCGSDSRHCW